MGSAVWIVFNDRDITLEFSRITEHRETLHTEVTVVSQATGEVGWTRLNVLASRTRADFARQLTETDPSQDWVALLEQACKALVRHLRAGQPPVPLVSAAPPEERWLVPGLIPRSEVSVLFADGGSGKSLLALALAVAGISGHALTDRWRVHDIQRALYLDWESDLATHAGRLHGLTYYREQPPERSLLYRQLHRPLTDHADELQAIVAREGIDMVVCDSLAPACGPEPEGADAAVRTMMAFRSLAPATILVLAHVSKQAAESTGKARPFGSVFVQNLARSTIEARRQESGGDDGELVLSLYHRKCNIGRLAHASAIAFGFEADGGITIREERADAARLALPEQILECLSGQKLSVSTIAEETGASASTVRSTLARLENRGKVVRLSVASGGRGKETEWGRVDTKRGSE